MTLHSENHIYYIGFSLIYFLIQNPDFLLLIEHAIWLWKFTEELHEAFTTLTLLLINTFNKLGHCVLSLPADILQLDGRACRRCRTCESRSHPISARHFYFSNPRVVYRQNFECS